MKIVTRRGTTTDVISRSPEETHRLGIRLAADLGVPGVLLLRGLLGTGKTTLTRGVAEGLGLSDTSLVSSPSFTLINIYRGRCPIYHVDLYRLSGAREIHSIGLEDFLGREGITIVEWSERLTCSIESAIEVQIEDAGGDARRIRICYPAAPGSARTARDPGVKKAGLGHRGLSEKHPRGRMQ